MGIYNTYGKVQIKIGNVDMKEYKVGDKVDIADGIYVGYGGVIVIKEGIFVMEVDTLTDKWGQPIKCDNVLRGRGLSELLDKTKETPKPEAVKPVEIAPKEEVVEVPKVEVIPAPEKVEEVIEKKLEEKLEETPKTEAPKIEEPKTEEKKEPVIEKEKTTPETPKEEEKK